MGLDGIQRDREYIGKIYKMDTETGWNNTQSHAKS